MTQEPELIFQSPPPTAGRPVGQTGIGLWVAQLRNHHGKWARFPEPFPSQSAAGGKATNIKKGIRYGVTAGEFEAVSRKEPEGYFLYVRYMGGDS